MRFLAVRIRLPTLFALASRKGMLPFASCSIGELDGWVLIVHVSMEMLEKLVAVLPDCENIIHVPEPDFGFVTGGFQDVSQMVPCRDSQQLGRTVTP